MTAEQAKPCRACTDFKGWMKTGPVMPSDGKSNPKTSSEVPKHELPGTGTPESISSKDTSENASPSQECPPDSEQLGRSTWTFLHTMASYYPDQPDKNSQQSAIDLMNAMSRLYPCSFCAKHLSKELTRNPPDVSSRERLEQWMCELHNEVNARQGKPLFDCRYVRERWRDGPKDGSCG